MSDVAPKSERRPKTPREAEFLRTVIAERIKRAHAEAQAADPTKGMGWLAHTMGVSPSGLARIRNGTSDPSVLEVWRLADAVGKPFGWFAQEDTEAAHQRVARMAESAAAEIKVIEVLLSDILAGLKDALSDAAAATGEAKVDGAARGGRRAQGAN